MYAPEFDYYRAGSVSEAAGLLRKHPGAKLLAGVGHRVGEAHTVVRQISAARGAHELSTDPGEVARLDASHTERAALLGGFG